MIARLIVLLLLVPLPAAANCAGADLREAIRADHPGAWATAAAEAAATPNGDGVLWRVEAEGAAPSLLYGSFHTAAPESAPMIEAVRAALPGLRVAMVEITEADRAAMQTAFHTNPGVFLNDRPAPLAEWLTAEELTAATQRLAPYGIVPQAAALIQPWFLSLMLASPPCAIVAAQEGMRPMDHVLAAEAAAAGAEVKGLERWEDQLAIFREATLEEQRDGFRMAIASPYGAEDTLATNFAFYADQTPWMIWELSLALARTRFPDRDVDAIAEEAEAMMLTKRNALMVDAALPELRAGGALVIVGALHLGGEDGLVAGLRAAGLTVTRVED